jgi:hypothetical protein
MVKCTLVVQIKHHKKTNKLNINPIFVDNIFITISEISHLRNEFVLEKFTFAPGNFQIKFRMFVLLLVQKH